MTGVPTRDMEHAFVAAVEQYDGDMVALCFVITGNRDLARDATQTTWLKLWREPPKLRDPGKLRSWLLAVAANEARQLLRKGRRVVPLERDEASSAPTEPSTVVALGQALQGLRPDERGLLGLKYVIGLNSTEIGEQLNITPGAVRLRLHRVLGKLREVLRDE